MKNPFPQYRCVRPVLLALLASPLKGALAQSSSVGIGTTAPSPRAALEIAASDKGLLIPRLDSVQRVAIASPPQGLLVYQKDSRTGLWYYQAGWQFLRAGNQADNLGNHTATQSLVLNDQAIRLRQTTDANHQLRYSSGVDGPQLFGYAGGELGINQGGYSPVLRWTAGGRVGIGTGTPQATLDVAGGEIRLPGGGGGITHFNFAGNNQNYIRGTTILADIGGNVGIGTASPLAKLHVAGSLMVGGVIQRGGSPITTTSDLGLYSRLPGHWMRFVTNGGAIRFFSDDDAGTAANLSIESNGNVGIGMSGASQKLEVAGQVYSSAGGFRFPDNTVQTTAATTPAPQTLGLSGQLLSISNGNSVTLPAGADNLGNHTATQNLNLGANQLVGNGGPSGLAISSTGNVGIGTTTPAALLHVVNPYAGTFGPNLAPTATITASSELATHVYNATSAVDNNVNSIWSAAVGQAFPQWLQVDFGSRAPIIRRYEVLGSYGDAAGTWQLQGSTDATAWTTLHTGTNANRPNSNTYVLNNTTPYRYYRLLITAALPPYSGSDVTVNEWRLMEEDLGAGGVAVKIGPGALALNSGAAVSSFSADGTLAGNADDAVPTQRAVKTYVDTRVAQTADNLGNHTATQALQLGANVVQFASTVAQKVQLFGTDYALGVQSYTHYARSADAFAWYTGGSHADNQFDAGGGTTQLILKNRKLGIGVTDEPVAPLEIRRDNADAYLTMHDPGDTWFSFGIHQSDGHKIKISDGGGFGGPNYLTIARSSGNVGIGTTTPSQKLHVVGNALVSGQIGIGWDPLAALDVKGNALVSDRLGIATINPTAQLDVRGTALVTDRIGIRTFNPQAVLDVQGSNTIGSYNFAFYARDHSYAPYTGSASHSGSDVSIRASGRVVASEFNATSDARLKNIVGRSDNAADLAVLNQLRITDYTMRDRAQYGTQRFKKVIAQEVEQVFSQAVSHHVGFLPDVYAPATAVAAIGDSLLLLTLPKTLPAASAGQAVKLIGRSGEVIGVVARAVAGGTTLLVRGARQLTGEEVFVFGLEHPDVRTVDYEALAMLNVSATQELARKVEALEKQNADTRQRAAQAERRAATAEAATQSFEQRLRELEARLGTAQK